MRLMQARLYPEEESARMILIPATAADLLSLVLFCFVRAVKQVGVERERHFCHQFIFAFARMRVAECFGRNSVSPLLEAA